MRVEEGTTNGKWETTNRQIQITGAKQKTDVSAWIICKLNCLQKPQNHQLVAVFAIPPASRFELDECCGGRSNLFIALVISYLDSTLLAPRIEHLIVRSAAKVEKQTQNGIGSKTYEYTPRAF